MNWEEVKKDMLRNLRVAKEYQALEAEHQLARSILTQRLAKGLSQRQLAARARTKQPVISRLETGAGKPSLRLLERVANALDADVVVRLEPHRGNARAITKARSHAAKKPRSAGARKSRSG
jgi:transcriptional regulator with XRE-family HTH domain